MTHLNNILIFVSAFASKLLKQSLLSLHLTKSLHIMDSHFLHIKYGKSNTNSLIQSFKPNFHKEFKLYIFSFECANMGGHYL